MTRVVLYLLALLTGFSAAEAARPVTATPAELGSAVALAVSASAAISAEQAQISEHRETFLPLAAQADAHFPAVYAVRTAETVKRGDRARE